MRPTGNNAPEVRDLLATVMVAMMNGATRFRHFDRLHGGEREGAGRLPRHQRVPREGVVCVAVVPRGAAPADRRVRPAQIRPRQAAVPAPRRAAGDPSAPLNRKNRGETPIQPASRSWRGDTPLTSTAIFRVKSFEETYDQKV